MVTTAQKSRFRKFLAKTRNILKGFYEALYGLVLHTFKNINRRIKSKFPLYRMHEETTEHVRHALQVFIWPILPLSLAYLFGIQFLFRQNLWGSMLWGIAVYFYSNFLPDFPAINRKRKRDPEEPDLPWYKKYTLFIFAPLFVWLLFSDVRLDWRTEETYHNFISLIVYAIFLFAVGLLAFVSLPLSIPSLLEALFLMSCGVTGFLTHLKVDKIW
jgi:hypothetical protein